MRYMGSQSHAAIDVSANPRTRLWTLLSYLVIGLVALAPRILDLGLFVTTDEADHWMERSELFLRALQTGDYAATAIAPHPGVTTMWLGSAGILLRHTLVGWGLLHDESFQVVLALMQLPVALIHTACILLGYHLLRQLLPAGPAALAALLWAADPFLIGYSRVLHVDALAGSFATLSLLAACSYWYHERRPTTLILSGVCAGLAILSKSPALAVLPIVGLIALTADRRPLATDQNQEPSTEDLESATEGTSVTRSPAHLLTRSVAGPFAALKGRLRSSVLALLAWGAVAAVTILALWPALWVDPWRTYAQLRSGVAVEGADPQMTTNFFLGQIDNDPGALFYPLALVLRLTPWTLVGLLMLWRAWRIARGATRRDLAALAGFVVLFMIALSLFPKKYNRYLIPAFPAVDILAAIGLMAIIDFRFQVLDFRLAQSPIKNLKSKILISVVALLAILNAALWHPYGITYFNTALGGPPMGARVFLEGWGEGFEQVATWLNQQSDITGVVTVSPMVSSLRPYMRRRAQVSDPSGGQLPNKTGYMVVYIRQVQGGAPDPPFDEFYGRASPLYTVRIHGVDYAWIYRIPPPVATAHPADFGRDIHLRGYEQQGVVQKGQRVALKLFWETRNAPPIDYRLFAHLIGPDGRRYTQVDIPYPTRGWGARQFVTTELPVELPPDMPAGRYRLMIGLYDPASGQRVPLTAAEQLDPTLDGPDALPLIETNLR